MKKLILTIAIILGMGTMSFAQFEGEVYEEAGLFGKGPGLFRDRGEDILMPNHNLDGDQDAEEIPLGSGIAVLVSLGGAYAIAKKRREE